MLLTPIHATLAAVTEMSVPVLYIQVNSFKDTMTSSNGNIFGVTVTLWGEIHWSPVNSRHKGQWRRALMFSLILRPIVLIMTSLYWLFYPTSEYIETHWFDAMPADTKGSRQHTFQIWMIHNLSTSFQKGKIQYSCLLNIHLFHKNT